MTDWRTVAHKLAARYKEQIKMVQYYREKAEKSARTIEAMEYAGMNVERKYKELMAHCKAIEARCRMYEAKSKRQIESKERNT